MKKGSNPGGLTDLLAAITSVARSEEPAAEAQRVEIALPTTPENRRN